LLWGSNDRPLNGQCEAIYVASERLRKKVFAIAANMLDARRLTEPRDGWICVVGSPGTSVSWQTWVPPDRAGTSASRSRRGTENRLPEPS
jgi:hypothetical protein